MLEVLEWVMDSQDALEEAAALEAAGPAGQVGGHVREGFAAVGGGLEEVDGATRHAQERGGHGGGRHDEVQQGDGHGAGP